jgi:transposase
MAFRHISEDLKLRVLTLIMQGHLEEDILPLFGVSQSSYKLWKRNFDRYGHTGRPPLVPRGRKPKIKFTHISSFVNLVAEAPDMLLREMQEWFLIAEELVLSRSEISRLLKDTNQTYKRLRKAAAERDEVERARWREEVQSDLLAEMCVCVDETSKDDRTIFRRFGHATSGQRAVLNAPFGRGQRWSIVAALSVDGYIAYDALEGSVNGFDFLGFIINQVVRVYLPLLVLFAHIMVASTDEPVSPRKQCPHHG